MFTNVCKTIVCHITVCVCVFVGGWGGGGGGGGAIESLRQFSMSIEPIG